MNNRVKKNITVLVGGRGLLGSGLKALLEKEKKEVVVLEDIKKFRKDLIPTGAREVIFLANSRDYRSAVMTKDLFFVNTQLVAEILSDCAKKGVGSFAYCSTGSVYPESRKPVREDCPVFRDRPTAYGATKCASEMLVRAWIPYFRRLVIFRPFFVYGSLQNKEMLFSSMIRRVIKGEKIYLKSEKGLTFNPIHVSDASRFMLCALKTKKGFDIYNVAGCETTTLSGVIKIMAGLLNKKPRVIRLRGREDILLGDITKMRLTGFRHKVLLKRGLRQMCLYSLNKRG